MDKFKTNPVLHKLLLLFNSGRFRLSVVVVVFALVGVAMLVNSRAATPTISIEPENGTITLPATKNTDTSASNGSAIKFAPATVPSGETQFTLASIPDVQQEMWSDTTAQRFNQRMNYFVANKAAWNLKYVMQVGDLQDWDDATHSHYVRASAGLKILDNAGIPYALSVGNHDTNAVCYGGSACPGTVTSVEVRNTSTWNSYYPPSRFPGIVTYQAGKTDTAYRKFTAGGLNWMIINYELWPRTDHVNWMKSVIAANPTYNVILISHSHLNGNSTIFGSNGGYGANSGQYVYDQVVKAYPNVRMTFSGHVGNAGYREDTGVNGNKIYSFLDCYHDTVGNPSRLLTINTANNTISTKVYSSWNNTTRTDAGTTVNISGVSWVR